MLTTTSSFVFSIHSFASKTAQAAIGQTFPKAAQAAVG
jgi:hypothetical protein